MEDRAKKRNDWLDAIKLLASFMVVFVHVSFQGKLGVLANTLSRFAVPLFFAVAGFFAFGADTKSIKRRFIKIVFLYLVSAAIYHVYEIICAVCSGGVDGFFSYLCERFGNTKAYFYFIFLNTPFSSEHLWFLLALAYVYLVWLLFIKLSVNDGVLFAIATACLVIHLIFGEGLSAVGITVPIEFLRNFALMGFPFFAFGYLANKQKRNLTKIKWCVLALILLLGAGESVLSRYLFESNEIYIGSVFCAFSLLVIAMKNENKKVDSLLRKLSSTSTDVYIYHCLISRLGILALGAIDESIVSGWFVRLWPILVCILSVAFSLLKNAVMMKVRKIKMK